LPSGETRNGRIIVNFESEGGRQAEVYRLPLRGAENYLYLIEPGIYRIAPARSIFGFYQPTMNVVIEGRTYSLPFRATCCASTRMRSSPARSRPWARSRPR